MRPATQSACCAHARFLIIPVGLVRFLSWCLVGTSGELLDPKCGNIQDMEVGDLLTGSGVQFKENRE